MSIARPHDLAAALDALAAEPAAELLAGGTDLMVQVNAGRRDLEHIVSLRRVAELRGWERDDGELYLGARMTFAMIQADLAVSAPSLAAAARTVGSPQIRNAGTLGGNIATASPAGDTLPPLAALEAEVVIAAPEGDRHISIGDFIVGVKRTALLPGEIVRGIRFPAARGPQVFLKVGTRNAMVIAVATCALVLDVGQRSVRCALGSVAPSPVRALDAERFAEEAIEWERGSVPEDAAARFGKLVAAAASPIDDHRSTSAYRRHAVCVVARRGLVRAARQLASYVEG
jgi:CO/xanthine dehydrogenase FAD-binding subunit